MGRSKDGVNAILDGEPRHLADETLKQLSSKVIWPEGLAVLTRPWGMTRVSAALCHSGQFRRFSIEDDPRTGIAQGRNELALVTQRDASITTCRAGMWPAP